MRPCREGVGTGRWRPLFYFHFFTQPSGLAIVFIFHIPFYTWPSQTAVTQGPPHVFLFTFLFAHGLPGRPSHTGPAMYLFFTFLFTHGHPRRPSHTGPAMYLFF